jgi:hypothetical protein
MTDQLKTGLLQASCPDLGPVRVLDARDPPEPLCVPVPKQARNRELREIARVGNTKIKRRPRLEHTRGFSQHSLDVRNVFQDRVAECTGKVIIRERRHRAIRFDQSAICAVFFRPVDRPVPGVEPHVDFTIEGQGCKMTVTAAYVIDRRGQIKILVICRFHAANEGTEVGQIPKVEGRENLFQA